ncbi:hypothetical protein [Salipiger marinus]|uniref:hypothetical protein n=1 Tax=Salipiger marinus TaxID=555512 RepID=UPI00104201C1|nr:hypothetical protein [Salipiger marinus]
MFEVEPTEESGGVCDCCGNQTRTVWGYVREEGGGTVASYFVHWTVGKSIEDHPANFDLIYGAWGEGATKNDRRAISLGRVDKRDSHRATGMIQAGVYDGDQLGTKSYVGRRMGVL